MSATSPAFGSLLRRFRMAAGRTQEDLAERAGLSARGISDLERGEREHPRWETVEALANALELDANDRGALIAAARDGNPAREPLTVAESPTNLPVSLTSLIGRDADVQAIVDHLNRPNVRLVNLTGPGGVGKTRLALQVATELRPAFAGGVFFVPLASLRDPGFVLATIANTLGLSDTSDTSAVAQLSAYARGKQILLVLDNLEHLLAAGPGVSELLRACPKLKVLTTSRALLRLSGEQEYVVSPLAVPDPHEATDLVRLPRVPAVALFLERLSAIAPGFTLTAHDAPALAEICARVDGLPLAIELAAVRTRHLTFPEMATRLQHRLDLLTRGPRDVPQRQQTLRDTIFWSYDLLTPDERRWLRWLSVFVGGWTIESAEALARDSGGSAIAIGDSLDALVDSSLVQLQRDAERGMRYGMLETIREFAEEELVTSGEAELVRERHADVVLAFTDRAERGLQSGERTAWSRAAIAEIDNVRAALRWCFDGDETERALRIVGNLDWFWDAVGRDAEGWAWTKAALALKNANQDSWEYARALYTAGAIAWNLADFDTSLRLLHQSVERFRVLGDRRSLGQTLGQLALTAYPSDPLVGQAYARESIAVLETVDDPWNLGLALFILGETLLSADLAEARAAYERSLAVFGALGDPWGMAHAITGLGGMAMRSRDYAKARALMEEGLDLRRAVNNSGAIATSLTSLGELARREGDDARAQSFLEQGLARFRDLGDAEHVAWTLYNFGMVALHRENEADADVALAECLVLRSEQGNNLQIAQTLGAIGRLALLRGEIERAALLLGAASGIRATNHLAVPTDEDGEAEQDAAKILRKQLGHAATTSTFARGRTLTIHQAIDIAIDRQDSSVRTSPNKAT